MLSLFPSLFTYELVAPFLIRLVLGAIFIFWAYKALKRGSGSTSNRKLIAAVEAVVGVLLVIGLWTQAAALVAGIDLIVRLFERMQKRAFLTDGINYYLVLLVLVIALLVGGAGLWAFDLPM